MSFRQPPDTIKPRRGMSDKLRGAVDLIVGALRAPRQTEIDHTLSEEELMSSGESLPESVSTGEPAPESGEPLPESFDLGASKIAPAEFPNRAWVYLKKLHDGKEQSFQQERNSLLETLTALSRDAEALAAEMGLLAYEIIRAAERQKKRGVEGEELTHLKTKLDNAMKKLNVRIENPLGEQLRDELLDHCEVIRNIPQPGTIGHIVGETITPIVIYQRKVVHRAEVIGWLGEQQNSQV